MDRNKTIISIIVIVAAVALFVGVGLWFFYPKNVSVANAGQGMPEQYVQGMGSNTTPAPSGTGTGGTTAPADPANTNPAIQQPANSIINQQVLVVDGAGNPASGDYQLGPDGRLVRNSGPETPAASPAPTPSPSPVSATKATDGLVVSAGSQDKAEVIVKPATKPAKETKAPIASAKPEDKPAATKAPAASAKPNLAVKKSGKEFWIQVVSTTSKDRVEQVRKDLAALGINGRVMTFSKDGTDFFRLRYGPYSEREEAAKFLEWVKMIRGLEGSFITEEKDPATAKPAAAAKPTPSKPIASPAASPAAVPAKP